MAEQPDTYARLLTTEKGDGNRDLSAHQSAIQNTWNNNVYENGEYGCFVEIDDSTNISVNNPGTMDELLDQVRQSSKVQNILDGYVDSVLVLDDRDYPEYTGYAYIGTAGSSYGVGTVASDGGKQTSTHELGHIYNADHGDTKDKRSTFENFGWYDYTVLGVGGAYSCNDNKVASVRELTYSNCTVNTIRNYIDSDL